MAEPTPPPTPPPAPAAPPPSTAGAGTESGGASSTTGDTSRNQGNKNQGKPRETFKGKVAAMDGHVFQLAEESRQPNQYTKTMKQLQSYVSVVMKHSTDLDPLFAKPAGDPVISEPDDLPPIVSGTVKGGNAVRAEPRSRKYIDWKFECETYNERKVALKANVRKLFSEILYQCSPSVISKLESLDGYERAAELRDCKWLVTKVKTICHSFEQTDHRFAALINAKKAILGSKQGAEQHVTQYCDQMMELIDVLESYGGRVHDPAEAAPSNAPFTTKTTDARKEKYMRDRYIGTLIILNADPIRFEKLHLELSNGFSLGRDEYPKTPTEAHQMLLNYKSYKPKRSDNPHTRREGGGTGRGADGGRGRGEGGGRGGGYRGRGGGGVHGHSAMQAGFNLTQGRVERFFADGIPEHYVLLDSDSTVSIFRSAGFLTNIRDADEPLCLESNGSGRLMTYQVGDLKHFGTVWYNPNAIANILSLAEVRRVRRVTMDTSQQPAFLVHKQDGTGTTVFAEHESGLYLWDGSTQYNTQSNTSSTVIAYTLLQTVAENKKKFTKRQVELADESRKLYHMLGRPGLARFYECLNGNYIINCPITVDDAKRAQEIYGTDVAFLKGKTTAKPPTEHLPSYEAVALPDEILSLHPKVTLCCDLFYILDLGFSLSTSRGIRYVSCRPIADRAKHNIVDCLDADLTVYRNRGFNPTEIQADNEYNCIRNSFKDVKVSICPADSHVPEAERAIRTMKETVRATIHGMPYNRLPRLMVRELVAFAARTYNMFPSLDGISATLSPEAIVTGKPKTDYNCLELEFGTYVQVYDGTSSDTKSRTLGAIALNPRGNTSGDHDFMSLATGERLHRRSWVVIPISDIVISRVEALAFDEGMPLVDRWCMLTESNPDEVVDESTYDKTYAPPETPDPQSDHDLTDGEYDDETDDDNDPDDDVDNNPPVTTAPVDIIHPTPAHNTAAPTITAPGAGTINIPSITPGPPVPAGNEERAAVPPTTEERDAVPPTTEERDDTQQANKERPRSGTRGTRRADYSYRYGFAQTAATADGPPSMSLAQIQRAIAGMPAPPPPTKPATQADAEPPVAPEPDVSHLQKAVFGLVHTQMSAQQGIKKHGKAAWDALKKEMQQFRDMAVLEALDPFTMADEEKTGALRALSVIKEKRSGVLKGRVCADGSPQQGLYSKAETGSSTISTDALFMTIMIHALEGRDVATADIAGTLRKMPFSAATPSYSD
jgi:hypothetical protein